MIAAEELMMTTLRQLMTSCDLNGPVLCNQVRLVEVDQFKVGAKVATFLGAHILMS